jgi:hypothetical protein
MVQEAPQQDFARVKSNIQKMLDQNAPEEDIDAYIASEGVTPEQLQSVALEEEQNAQRRDAGAGGVYSGPIGTRAPITQAGDARVSTDRDREYSNALAKAFADGGGQPELDAISQRYGYPAIPAEQVERGLQTRRSGGYVTFDVPVSGNVTVTPEQAEAGADVALNGQQGSFIQGIAEGAANVGYHVAGAAEGAADFLGVKEPLQDLGQFLNPGQPREVGEARGNFEQGIDNSQYASSGLGKFVGESAALGPIARLPGGPALQGMVAGGVMSDREGLGKLVDITAGGVASSLSSAALRGGAQVANPDLSPELQTLFREGVRATPGQMARATGTNAGRAVGWAEDIVGGIPGIGAPIAAAQRAGVEDFSRAPVNRALRAIGERLPRDVPAGYNAIDHAQERFSAAYRDVLPRLNGQLDPSFQRRVNTIRQRARIPAESAASEALESATQELGNAFTGVGQNGVYNGRSLRDASERLGDLSSAWRRSDDPYMRIAGDVADQYRRQLHSLARRQNPEYAGRLRDIDRGYASLVRAERGAVAGDAGIATPRQYQSAVRQEDRSARRRQFAAGNALDQDLSNAGVAVLANRAAQGGSKDINGLAAVGGAALGLGSGNPGGQALGLLGLGTLAGTAATHNPLLLRGLQATLGRQTHLSPETARVLRLLAQASPSPSTIGALNLVNADGN